MCRVTFMVTLIKETAEGSLISSIQRFGKTASLLLLSTPCQTFELPDVEGLIGYQLANECAVVIGDPLCSSQDMPKMTEGFLAHCRKLGHSIVYLLVSETFAHSSNGCKALLQAGDELVLDPPKFQLKQKLRWKIHQAEQHGVTIKEYDPSMENQLKETMKKWSQGKHGPQIYLGTLDFFEGYGDRRIFYAVQEGKVIGFVTILYLAPKEGWVVTSLLALHGAPVGVTEALMNHVLTTLTEEHCHFLCLGFVADCKIGEMTGISTFSQSLIRGAYSLALKFFHLDAKRIYFNKYHPTYHPTYLLCSDKLGIKELLAIKKTLNVKL